MDAKELEALNLFHYSSVNENFEGEVVVEGDVVILAPQGQVSDLLPICCLIVVGVQAYHCCVVSKLNDGVGVVPGRAVMSEQGVQAWTEHAPLRGPRVEDQRGGCVVTYL